MKKDEKDYNKKKKNKRKKKIKIKLLPILLLVVVIICAISSYFIYNYLQDSALRTIKKNYSNVVITTNEARLYNKNRKIIGTISKDVILDLKEIKNLSLKNKYFQLDNTDYYIKYKDVKKSKKEEQAIDNYYLPLDLSISSKNKVKLLDDKKTIITLNNGVSIDVEYMDKDYYYVRFQSNLLRIKKDKSIKEKKSNKDITGAAKSISVIKYDTINYCDEDTCLKPESVRIHINKLKNEGYYFITKDDFVNYINGYRNLKEKAVFLTTNEENDYTNSIKNDLGVEIKPISAEDGITLAYTNKAATKDDDKNAVNCYSAKKYTLIDNYSLMASGIEVPDNGKENSNNQHIAVLNYHFFYDGTIPEEAYACRETICLEKEKFREHLQWLQDNGYKTLSIYEYADWMDGNIEIPDKSVLLTVDDGAHGTGAHNGNVLIPLLEEYKMHATLFLITGWWDISNYQSPYLEIQSHTDNLHYEANCADGRGMVACSDYATVKTDIAESINKLSGDNNTFCFPFYSYDNESLQAIKELGFRYSFIGGSKKSSRNDNHYLVPRYPIMSDITLNDFISMVS